MRLLSQLYRSAGNNYANSLTHSLTHSLTQSPTHPLIPFIRYSLPGSVMSSIPFCFVQLFGAKFGQSLCPRLGLLDGPWTHFMLLRIVLGGCQRRRRQCRESGRFSLFYLLNTTKRSRCRSFSKGSMEIQERHYQDAYVRESSPE
jgi:hypothetical protein